MKKIQCELCGSIDIIKVDDKTFQCRNCGVKYSTEEVKKLIVNVDGPVKIDNSERLSNLYELARADIDLPSCGNAGKYYEEILISEPTSWEARFFSAYCKAQNCKMIEARSAPNEFVATLNYTLLLIKKYVTTEDEKKKAVETIFNYCYKLKEMFKNGAEKNYEDDSSRTPIVSQSGVEGAFNYRMEKKEIENEAKSNFILDAIAAFDIMKSLGDELDDIFFAEISAENENDFALPYVIASWENYVDDFLIIYKVNYIKAMNERFLNELKTYEKKINKYVPDYKIDLDKKIDNKEIIQQPSGKGNVIWALLATFIGAIVFFFIFKSCGGV